MNNDFLRYDLVSIGHAYEVNATVDAAQVESSPVCANVVKVLSGRLNFLSYKVHQADAGGEGLVDTDGDKGLVAGGVRINLVDG